VLSGIVRFAVEFVRRNPMLALGLTLAQWVSLASIAVGGALLLRGQAALRPRPA
jgi:prolipoprotein diacylglyceryltransferase